MNDEGVFNVLDDKFALDGDYLNGSVIIKDKLYVFQGSESNKS